MEIHNASYVTSSARADQCPKADKPEYAFIGRSNVGKSSLINMLTADRQEETGKGVGQSGEDDFNQSFYY